MKFKYSFFILLLVCICLTSLTNAAWTRPILVNNVSNGTLFHNLLFNLNDDTGHIRLNLENATINQELKITNFSTDSANRYFDIYFDQDGSYPNSWVIKNGVTNEENITIATQANQDSILIRPLNTFELTGYKKAIFDSGDTYSAEFRDAGGIKTDTIQGYSGTVNNNVTVNVGTESFKFTQTSGWVNPFGRYLPYLQGNYLGAVPVYGTNGIYILPQNLEDNMDYTGLFLYNNKSALDEYGWTRWRDQDGLSIGTTKYNVTIEAPNYINLGNDTSTTQVKVYSNLTVNASLVSNGIEVVGTGNVWLNNTWTLYNYTDGYGGFPCTMRADGEKQAVYLTGCGITLEDVGYAYTWDSNAGLYSTGAGGVYIPSGNGQNYLEVNNAEVYMGNITNMVTIQKNGVANLLYGGTSIQEQTGNLNATNRQGNSSDLRFLFNHRPATSTLYKTWKILVESVTSTGRSRMSFFNNTAKILDIYDNGTIDTLLGNIHTQNIYTKGNVSITGHLNVTEGSTFTNNLIVKGNFSAKRPYWNGYDNSTQNFLNTNNVQIINISNNADYDNYLIDVSNSQNVTFQQTGEYICALSPEFFQNGGGSLVTFWYQKNGVDVNWSNSRYSMTNNEYHAPNIFYQFDITNPATDYIRFIWWSDSTNTQIYSSGALINPTRPSIPGILLNCYKVSEIT